MTPRLHFLTPPVAPSRQAALSTTAEAKPRRMATWTFCRFRFPPLVPVGSGLLVSGPKIPLSCEDKLKSYNNLLGSEELSERTTLTVSLFEKLHVRKWPFFMVQQ